MRKIIGFFKQLQTCQPDGNNQADEQKEVVFESRIEIVILVLLSILGLLIHN